jgi:hypothetical protein
MPRPGFCFHFVQMLQLQRVFSLVVSLRHFVTPSQLNDSGTNLVPTDLYGVNVFASESKLMFRLVYDSYT